MTLRAQRLRPEVVRTSARSAKPFGSHDQGAPSRYNRQWHTLDPDDDEYYYMSLDEFLGQAEHRVEEDLAQAQALLALEKRRLDETDWRNRNVITSRLRCIASIERAIAKYTNETRP